MAPLRDRDSAMKHQSLLTINSRAYCVVGYAWLLM